MGEHEVIQGAGVIQVVHGIPDEHLVIHRLGDVPTDQTFDVTELVLQQKNESKVRFQQNQPNGRILCADRVR